MTYTDWAATVLFYRTLHSVQAFLVEEHAAGRLTEVPQKHEARGRVLRQEHETVWRPYKRLHQLSTQARYRCSVIPPARIAEAERHAQQVDEAIERMRSGA